ncbi:MAG: hypothetical protein JXQ30_04200 [Spirochaetes bacterium]|nr:hypothetical protein [Spirochaetota bacterium]
MPDSVKLNRFLVRMNRVSAYVLLLVAVLMIVTGYRSTGRFAFFSRGFADITHRIHLNIAFVSLLSLHSVLSTRTALQRRNIGGTYVDIALIIAGAVFIAIFTLLVFI